VWLEHSTAGPYLVQLRDRGGANEKRSVVLEVSKLFEAHKTMPVELRNPLFLRPFRFVIPFATSSSNSRLSRHEFRKLCPIRDGTRASAAPGPAGTCVMWTGYRTHWVGARPQKAPLRAGSRKAQTARHCAALLPCSLIIIDALYLIHCGTI